MTQFVDVMYISSSATPGTRTEKQAAYFLPGRHISTILSTTWYGQPDKINFYRLVQSWEPGNSSGILRGMFLENMHPMFETGRPCCHSWTVNGRSGISDLNWEITHHGRQVLSDQSFFVEPI